MTNQQILGKAIKKALDGGWAPHYEPRTWSVTDILHWYRLGKYATSQWNDDNWNKFVWKPGFAKALWGEEDGWELAGTTVNGKVWQNHLQQMVVSDDPIKYLSENM